MQIKVKELVDILEKVKKALSQFDYIELDERKEYFWNILSEEELYNPNKKPSNLHLGLGKLSEEWEDLMHLKSGDEDDVPITYDLTNLARILRSIQDNSDIVLC